MVPPRAVEHVSFEARVPDRERRQAGHPKASGGGNENVARLDLLDSGHKVFDPDRPNSFGVRGIDDGGLKMDVTEVELVDHVVNVG